jgi:hypothetical protein
LKIDQEARHGSRFDINGPRYCAISFHFHPAFTAQDALTSAILDARPHPETTASVWLNENVTAVFNSIKCAHALDQRSD